MADRPILFSAPMVRALLAGTKTQTRRVLTAACDEPPAYVEGGMIKALDPEDGPYRWPRTHAVGDRLWVREAWRSEAAYDDLSPSQMGGEEPIRYEADGAHQTWGFPAMLKVGRLRPGMFMPRWASRLTQTVTDVRVERLQDISEADAIAEGVSPLPSGRFHCGFDEEGEITSRSAITAYGWVWNAINGEDAWSANPWVAAYTFTVHHHNIDQDPAHADPQ